MCLVVTFWERADLFALVCGVQLRVCHFPIGILGQVWYLIVSIPDLCTLTYFDFLCRGSKAFFNVIHVKKKAILNVVKYGNVMVRYVIRGTLIGQRYVNEVLHLHVLPIPWSVGNNFSSGKTKPLYLQYDK